MRKAKCPDCDAEVPIPDDTINGEIVSCPCCGLELEYQDGELSELLIEGEDWGE